MTGTMLTIVEILRLRIVRSADNGKLDLLKALAFKACALL